MTLAIAPIHLQQICDQAMTEYPQECCGLLVGKIIGTTKQTIAIYPMQNVWVESSELDYAKLDGAEPTHSTDDRYQIDPAAMLQVMKQSRDQGLEIIGIYHSHPDHPAIPSETDRQLAWPQYAYLIVSVTQGQVIDRQSWCLDLHHQFRSEMIQMIN